MRSVDARRSTEIARSFFWSIGLALAVAGCATDRAQDPLADPPFESRLLAYDSLVIEVLAPSAREQNVTATTPGDGAREGATKMLQSPVSCMQTGMLYGFCLAIAPLFPLIAASRIQDEEISRRELEAMAAHIDSLGLQHRFEGTLERLANTEKLPLEAPSAAGFRSARLRVELGTVLLEHNGYEGGTITVTQPYRFELLDAGGRTATVVSGERVGRFDVDEWSGEPGLDDTLNRWIEQIAEKGLRETVIEWHPRIVLAARNPEPIAKRNIIGIKQEFWPYVAWNRPLLEWQSLTEVLDPDVLAEISDVSYELRIVGYAGVSRYTVEGLLEPRHEVATELMPCTYYRWEPRARFRYRGVSYKTSLRTRPWSKTLDVDDHYLIKTTAPDCEEPMWRSEPVAGESTRSN